MRHSRTSRILAKKPARKPAVKRAPTRRTVRTRPMQPSGSHKQGSAFHKKKSPRPVAKTGRASSRPAKPAKHPKTLSFHEVKASQARQAQTARTEAIREKLAKQAAIKFRPRKADKGKYIFIGKQGGRNPEYDNRPGYLIYVDSKGHKKLIKQPKKGFQPIKFIEAQTPFHKKTAAESNAFKARKRLLKKQDGKQIEESPDSWQTKEAKEYSQANPEKRGLLREQSHVATGGANEFDKALTKLSDSVEKAINAQASHREFIIRTIASVKDKDGRSHTFAFNVDLEKADHIKIERSGIKGFVSRKYYANLARELSFLGFVTKGSSNHIRKLKENKGKTPDKWTNQGELWYGRGLDIVELKSLEWKIEQAK